MGRLFRFPQVFACRTPTNGGIAAQTAPQHVLRQIS
jgi:hypothetical protein